MDYLSNLGNKVTSIINGATEAVKVTEPTITSSKYEEVDVINLRNIRQVYNAGTKNENVLFDNFNFDIKDIKGEGQFISLLGKSGCGKCFSKNTVITIRNKTTKQIEDINIDEFLKRFPQQE